VPVPQLTKNSGKNLKNYLKYPLFARLNLPHARTQIHTTQDDVSMYHVSLDTLVSADNFYRNWLKHSICILSTKQSRGIMAQKGKRASTLWFSSRFYRLAILTTTIETESNWSFVMIVQLFAHF
jgi:hypothetical protein